MPGGGKLYHNLGFQEMVLRPIFCAIFVGKPRFLQPNPMGFLSFEPFLGEKSEICRFEMLEAVCFVPVHDNYLLNKQTVAGKQLG